MKILGVTKSDALCLDIGKAYEALLSRRPKLRSIELPYILKHKYLIRKIGDSIEILIEPKQVVLRLKEEEWSEGYKLLVETNYDFVCGYGLKQQSLNLSNVSRIVLFNKDAFEEYVTPKTDPLYFNVPFGVIKTRKEFIGIFIDTGYCGEVIFGKGMITYKLLGTGFRAFLILDREPLNILKTYGEITGFPNLPPKWALGYHHSRYSYEHVAEVLDAVNNLINLKVPCSAIWLDIGYLDNYRPFTWNRKHFSRPKELVRRLHKLGLKVVAIFDPYIPIGEKYAPYEECMKINCYIFRESGEPLLVLWWPGYCLLPDFFRENVARWWARKVATFVREYDLDGVWLDMNEPSTNPKIKTDISEEAYVMFMGRPIKLNHVRNIYSLMQIKAVWEELVKYEKRPFILTRAGTAGVQRYAFCWTGDTRSTWKHLKHSIIGILNLSMSGMPFCGADIGGFMSVKNEDSDEELYLRWFQLGALYPFCRLHYMKKKSSRDPWVFRRVFSKVRKAIKFRYRLIPYLYTLAYLASKKLEPIWRPLFLHFWEDEKVYNIEQQFMLGPWLLVIPILQKNQDKLHFYLPSGIWVDFWTNNIIKSRGEYFSLKSKDNIQIFLRNGSIVPLNGYNGRIEVLIVGIDNVKSEFVIYDDEGDGFGYKRGFFDLVQVKLKSDGNTLNTRIRYLHRGLGVLDQLQLRAITSADKMIINERREHKVGKLVTIIDVKPTT